MDRENSVSALSAPSVTEEDARKRRIASHLEGRAAHRSQEWYSGHKGDVIVGIVAFILANSIFWLLGGPSLIQGVVAVVVTGCVTLAVLKFRAKSHGLKRAHVDIMLRQENVERSLRLELDRADRECRRLEAALDTARSLPARALDAACKQLRAFAALYTQAFYYASGQFGFEDGDCDRSAVRHKKELDRIAQEYIRPVLGEMRAQDFDYHVIIIQTVALVHDELSQPNRDHILSTLNQQAGWMRNREQDLTCEQIESYDAAINLARPLEQIQEHLERLR